MQSVVSTNATDWSHGCNCAAAAGYMSFWVVAKLFFMHRGVDGLGQGDFKLFALIGAWGGWQILPTTLLIASLATAAVGISIRLRGSDRPLPFGPGLVIGGLLCLMFGSGINHWLLYRQ
ncbi:prepilin peptidase [Pseudomonas sp. V1]|uniref:prepilin peptidase n=1 Tax=Pseudomonas arcuscaelestis TaxID=2710591 RepID=UPI00193F0338|nr:A24 family peptidase [Pseudomonas arcuscaelestis]MBM3105783.1 prepilin peptidase [Pseudomonas arcuscaelestis]